MDVGGSFMNYIQLGASDIRASQLGLGCINFGTTTTKETAFALMDCYLECGGNLLDTANNYAIWNGGDDGRKIILEEVEKSLEALRTSYLDVLYLHVDDYGTELQETLATLAEVIKKGYVRQIGCSNFRTWRIEKARQICKQNDYPFFCAIQQRYSYLQPVMDAKFGVQVAAGEELRDYIEYYKDLTMVSHTSLLFGTYLNGQITDPNYQTKANEERLRFLREQQTEAVPWVLRYITEQFGGSIALFTSNSVEHLKRNLQG